MATFTWTPDKGVDRTFKPRVNEAKFGDGYGQRSADAINNLDESWSLSFTVRTATEIAAIEAFLATAKGVSNFDWTTPAGNNQKFVCRSWSSSYNYSGDNSLQATFDRVFEQ
jgi:phage-related protein